jgi:RHS repeat-associated protein
MQKIISKTIYCCIAAMACTCSRNVDAQTYPVPYNSTASVNYVRTWDATAPETDPNALLTKSLKNVIQTTQYSDGLGRALQTVIKQGSLVTGQTAIDLVFPTTYDQFGREVRRYLPFAANNTGGNSSISDGLLKLNPFQQDSTFNKAVFSQESWYYSQINFEASPLTRISESFFPGDSWVGTSNEANESNRRSIKSKYWLNTLADSVRIWNVTDVANGFGTYASSGIYDAGTLFKRVSIDEANSQTIEFRDKDGKLILKKIQLSSALVDTGSGKGHSGWQCTYYIYDILENLRCIVQPKGVELISNDWVLTDDTILAEQCFRYEYDKRNRIYMKKIPGAGSTWIVHDARDRVVLSQDSLMRSAHQWLYCQYDELNRVIANGLITDNNGLSYHLVRADTSIAYPAAGVYTVDTLIKTFYDDYAWRAGQGNPLSNSRNTDNDSYLQMPSDGTWPYPQNATSNASLLKGFITGTKTKVLGTASSYLYTVNFYDNESRLIQQQSQNITGGIDVFTTQYTWTGRPILLIEKNGVATNSQTNIVLTQITYDSIGCLIKVEKKASNTKVNGGSMPGSWKSIAQSQYDALGRLVKKKLGAGPVDSLNYEYNIRGWMLGMNRSYVKDTTSTADFFGYDLGYDKNGFSVNGNSFSYNSAQYNGNIAGLLWKSAGDGQLRRYDFNYDGVTRLLSADFNQLSNGAFCKAAGLDFSVSDLSYDLNGNILTMKQKGWKGTQSVIIDNLLYTYIPKSNRVLKIVDSVATNNKLGDFYDGTNGNNNDYVYDGNGNVNVDNNKDIGNIHYGLLNLPDSITVNGKGKIKYIYDAAGNKLKKITTEGGTTTTTLFLLGNYVNDTLQFLSHEEGRIRFNVLDSSFQYDYFIKDHLDNIRMVLTEQADTAKYPQVKFENASVNIENIYFDNVFVGRTGRPGGFYSQTTNGDTVQLLRSATAKIGVGKLLKVMAKDKLHITVDYYIQNDPTDNSGANGLNTIVNTLGNLIDNNSITLALHGDGSSIVNTLNNSVPFTNFLAPQTGTGGTMPKAYLNILFFDEQFRFVSTNSEIIQVDTKGSGQTITRVFGNAKQASKNGYVYIFVSNESNNFVYFDNLIINHERGPIIEETHYYPFGLPMAGISTNALNFGNPDNLYEYNGNEKQEKEFADKSGLNWVDYGSRNYDVQTGRWLVIDPLASRFATETPFNYAGNNPISNVDLDGAFKYPKNLDAKYRKTYKRFTKFLEGHGMEKLLNSKVIVDAFKKYGHLSLEQLKKDFKWGSGPTLVFTKNPGCDGRKTACDPMLLFAKGYTNYPRGDVIEISSDLLDMLENAKQEDIEAALLRVVATAEHEENHRGEMLTGYYGDDDVGRLFGDDVYSRVVDGYKVVDLGFDATHYSPDGPQLIIEGAKKIIESKGASYQCDVIPDVNIILQSNSSKQTESSSSNNDKKKKKKPQLKPFG